MEFRAYTVTAVSLDPTRSNRAIVVATDEDGEFLSWSCQLDRVPRLGLVVEITMRAQEDPPEEDRLEPTKPYSHPESM